MEDGVDAGTEEGSGGKEDTDAKYQWYMSLAPRFWTDEIEERKVAIESGVEGNAARSAVSRAGLDCIEPRSVIRRPFWSVSSIVSLLR